MRCCLSWKECFIIPFPKRCMPSPLFSIWLTLLSPFFTASLPLFFHDWENETFCVKCGLNADHFISMVRMRTKSAIADFYGSSAPRPQFPLAGSQLHPQPQYLAFLPAEEMIHSSVHFRLAHPCNHHWPWCCLLLFSLVGGFRANRPSKSGHFDSPSSPLKMLQFQSQSLIQMRS